MDDFTALMWIWLKLAVNNSSSKAYKLYEHFKDIKLIYEAGPKEFEQVKGIEKFDICKLLNKDLYESQETLLLCQKNQIDIIPIDDERYPALLREIKQPPCVLFVYGNYNKAISKPCVAVVGSRDCTTYGVQIASQYSGALAISGCTIVTGIADGIDKAAYSGAVKANGNVILVLPEGFLVSHYRKSLPHISYSNTAVITEHLPTYKQTVFAYHERNRIISGLGICCFIPQAGKNSGALITANHALEQGRDIFVAPSNINLNQSIGSNKLFYDGALPAITYKDILDYVKRYYPDAFTDSVTQSDLDYFENVESQVEINVESYKKIFKPMLPPEAASLLDIFDSVDLTFDYIVQRANRPVSQILTQLSILESAGAIIALPGNKYRINLNKQRVTHA